MSKNFDFEKEMKKAEKEVTKILDDLATSFQRELNNKNSVVVTWVLRIIIEVLIRQWMDIKNQIPNEAKKSYAHIVESDINTLRNLLREFEQLNNRDLV